MNGKTRTRVQRPFVALLAMLGSVASPSAFGADAPARVEFSIGRVSAVDANGDRRRLRKGASINVGDSIVTERGRVHLRFSDGGYVSLKPNTEFRVDAYQFEEKKASGSRSFFNLLRGGLRAITGLIGKRDRKGYRMRTPAATIGIRGTIFEADVGNSVTVRVVEGAIELIDDAGEIIRVVNEGEEVTYDETTGTVTIGGQTVSVPDAETASDLGLPEDAVSSEDVDGAGRSAVLGYD
jgi:hypothetical protein